METQPRTPLSRWDDDPIILPDGTFMHVRPTKRDKELLFPVLDPVTGYKVAPADYLYFFLGGNAVMGNYKHFRRHLAWLSRKPGSYLHRHRKQLKSEPGNRRCQCYSLPDTPLHNFWHDLGAAMIGMQIEHGAKLAGLDYVDFQRILVKAPIATQKLERPATLELTYKSATGKDTRGKITADRPPFIIGNGRKGRFYFGVERDCDSEDMKDSKSSSKETLAKKFRKNLAINEQKLAKKIYNLDGPFFFPYLPDLPSRVDSMRRELLRVTGGKGSPYHLFRYFPSYWDNEDPPELDGEWFKGAWKRAGYDDFYMHRF